ncbi:uncharacterized protein LOC131851523 [Achroia grisella]|uniref:uncharacterized protein LOC131851523 n=1 Tax=Achroia grisella TaxID=688607 RepID=UPI0027D25035|nr:uncharacterized protein LOC131851523 [Achroia grisella]
MAVQVDGPPYALTLSMAPATPEVPHAEVLDEILTGVMNRTEFEGSVFSYLFGNHTEPPNEINIQHLDVSILDRGSVQKIIDAIKDHYEANNTRRHEALHDKNVFSDKAFDLMKQSIYATRYRMLETKPFRDKYKNDISYNIAVMFGAMMQIKTKMENMYATMERFPRKTHFLWYLVLYEKILACYVDVEQMTDKMFQYHNRWLSLVHQAKDKLKALGMGTGS